MSTSIPARQAPASLRLSAGRRGTAASDSAADDGAQNRTGSGLQGRGDRTVVTAD
ncbi:hypothetical protein [Lentzea tibetensis]|uniref:hypothetical protein n=1 Tax=Lentzea tibetensis TaxID=2591470 RepID=UPI001647F0C4|nr:hypothetical protein [Lentzea tibetensis]